MKPLDFFKSGLPVLASWAYGTVAIVIVPGLTIHFLPQPYDFWVNVVVFEISWAPLVLALYLLHTGKITGIFGIIAAFVANGAFALWLASSFETVEPEMRVRSAELSIPSCIMWIALWLFIRRLPHSPRK